MIQFECRRRNQRMQHKIPLTHTYRFYHLQYLAKEIARVLLSGRIETMKLNQTVKLGILLIERMMLATWFSGCFSPGGDLVFFPGPEPLQNQKDSSESVDIMEGCSKYPMSLWCFFGTKKSPQPKSATCRRDWSIRIWFLAAKRSAEYPQLQVLGRFGFARGGRENLDDVWQTCWTKGALQIPKSEKGWKAVFFSVAWSWNRTFRYCLFVAYPESLHNFSDFIFPHFFHGFVKILSWSNKLLGFLTKASFKVSPVEFGDSQWKRRELDEPGRKKPKEQAVLTNTVLFWLQINVLFVDICCNYLE